MLKSKQQREIWREIWIKETQMFQRIAGTPVTSAEELGAEFDQFERRRCSREVDSIRALRAVQDVTRRAKD